MSRRIIFFVTESQLTDLALISANSHTVLDRVRYLTLIKKGLVRPGTFAGEIQLTALGELLHLNLGRLAGSEVPPKGHAQGAAAGSGSV